MKDIKINIIFWKIYLFLMKIIIIYFRFKEACLISKSFVIISWLLSRIIKDSKKTNFRSKLI